MLAVNKPQKVSLYGNDYVLWKDLQGNINTLENTRAANIRSPISRLFSIIDFCSIVSQQQT